MSSEYRCRYHGAGRHEDCISCQDVIAVENKYRRHLCYIHHKEEFDTLPNSQRHRASVWVTGEKSNCELCSSPVRERT